MNFSVISGDRFTALLYFLIYDLKKMQVEERHNASVGFGDTVQPSKSYSCIVLGKCLNFFFYSASRRLVFVTV